MQMTPGFEVAHIKMDASGDVVVTSGTCGHGQGHETTFAQLVADRLGISPDRVKLRQGDTDLTSFGWGTFGSRSLVIGGGSAAVAARRLADQVRQVAAELLEADPADIDLVDGNARGPRHPARPDLDRRGRGHGALPLAHAHPSRGAAARGPGHGGPVRDVLQRLSCRACRDRSRYWRRPRPGLHRGRGLRSGGQPDDRRRPGPRRSGPGHRHGALRGARLLPGGPAPRRHIHGLPGAHGHRDPHRGRAPPGDSVRPDRDRGQGHGGGRLDRRAGHDPVRTQRRPAPPHRPPGGRPPARAGHPGRTAEDRSAAAPSRRETT